MGLCRVQVVRRDVALRRDARQDLGAWMGVEAARAVRSGRAAPLWLKLACVPREGPGPAIGPRPALKTPRPQARAEASAHLGPRAALLSRALVDGRQRRLCRVGREQLVGAHRTLLARLELPPAPRAAKRLDQPGRRKRARGGRAQW